MPFRFSLQPVLRFRKSFERRERQRLEAISRELTNARQRRDQAKLDRENALAQLQAKVRQGLTIAEMQFELACDRACLRRIAACGEEVAKLDNLRSRQVEVFRKAQQERKILENLRESQLAAYRLVQGRREQQQTDDRYLMTQAGNSPAG
jgi:flagellar export protein FliJ